jgi:hypothetical protein
MVPNILLVMRPPDSKAGLPSERSLAPQVRDVRAWVDIEGAILVTFMNFIFAGQQTDQEKFPIS